MATVVCAYDETLWSRVYWSLSYTGVVLGVGLFFVSMAQDTKRNRWGVQWMVKMYSTYLLAWFGALWLVQVALNDVRPDPFCPGVTWSGFPSINTFYSSSFTAFVVLTTYLYNRPFGWVWWLTLLGIFFGVPLVLSALGPSTWREILTSVGLGLLSAIIFVAGIHYCIKPYLPWLLNCAPFTWFGCIDTWIMSDEEHETERRIRQSLGMELDSLGGSL